MTRDYRNQPSSGPDMCWSTASEPALEVCELAASIPHSSLLVLIDDKVPSSLLPLSIFENMGWDVAYIQGGEESKQLSRVANFINTHQSLLDKRSLVVVAGGGSLLDFVGLCCGLFFRGIRYMSVPTSVMALADAAYGGKTAVNAAAKNQIGMYHAPTMVYCNPHLLDTLPSIHVRSGLVEIAKLSFFSPPIAEHLSRIDPAAADTQPSLLGELSRISAFRKLELLATDPREQAGGSVLLYGHPFGNAFEAHAWKEANVYLPHGFGVALGISLTAFAAERLGMRPYGAMAEEMAILQRVVDFPRLAESFTPPTLEEMLRYLRNDKYVSEGAVTMPAACSSAPYTTVSLATLADVYNGWRDLLASTMGLTDG